MYGEGRQDNLLYLAESYAHIVVQLCLLAEVEGDGVLPGWYMHQRRRRREQPAISDKVLRAQCRAHDKQLEGGTPAFRRHLSPQRNNARQHACSKLQGYCLPNNNMAL